MPSGFYDIVFVAKLLLDEHKNYFSGGAEIHLRNCISAVNHGRVLVIQRYPWSNKTENICKDNVEFLLITSKSDALFKMQLARALKTIKARWVHFNYIGLERFISKNTNTFYSATFHGTGWDFPITNFQAPYQSNDFLSKTGALVLKIEMIIEQLLALKKLDRLLSVDSSLSRFSSQFYPSTVNKIITIPNFVDQKKFCPQVKKNYSKRLKILFPRNISYARGVSMLVPLAVKLVQKMVDFEILIAGAPISNIGGTRYEIALKSEISAHGLQDRFIFLGRLDHSQMPQIYQKADICIIPSIFSEGTSLSCLESMASGVPVVASSVGGLNDLITDGYNGYLARPDPNDFADKIVKLASDKLKMREISRRALDIVATCYSYESWKKKIREFFSQA